MRDSDPPATFGYAVERLNPFHLAYVHLMEPLPGHPMAGLGERISPHLRRLFKGTLVICGGFNAQLGAAAIRSGETDLVAFGLPFLANPDLVGRFQEGASFNDPDFVTLYTPGPQGYTDYPALRS
jgi:N-ethylmaleimide reductase